MGTSSEQHYSLRWNDYTVKIVTAFQSLRDEEDFVDVTVACDGHHYSAHKMVLSACSPYFRSLLRANPCQHPIVILKDVGHIEMERLLEFMYNGEVNIAQDQLAAFLKTAESLKIRGLAGSSDDLDQIHTRDPHNYSGCLSGGTGTIGGVSGRNSPSVSFNSSQDCKDDDITTDGIFHTNSPSTKRRKRASAVLHADNSSSQATDNLTGEGLIESGSDRVNISGDQSIDLEDERMDRRELKSEPSDALGEVYVESDMGTDQSQHSDGIDHRPIIYPLALPGPSGSSVNQDGLPPGENAAAPQSAVCEALNLSLRSTPAIPQLNGSTITTTTTSSSSNSFLPASVSIQRHHQQQQQHHHQHHHGMQERPMLYEPLANAGAVAAAAAVTTAPLQPPSNAVSLRAPLQLQFKCEDDYEEKVHPEIMSAVVMDATTSDGHQIYDAAMDLVCGAPVDKKPFSEANYDIGQVTTVSIAENAAAVRVNPATAVAAAAAASGPVYKTKVYPCPECLKVFRHPMSLHHHRHVHKGTYTCQSCGKVFSRRWDLHRHIHRSKMGCRRPNHHTSSTTTESHGLTAATPLRPDHAYDLTNPPSN